MVLVLSFIFSPIFINKWFILQTIPWTALANLQIFKLGFEPAQNWTERQDEKQGENHLLFKKIIKTYFIIILCDRTMQNSTLLTNQL
jgi:hypothetical protein